MPDLTPTWVWPTWVCVQVSLFRERRYKYHYSVSLLILLESEIPGFRYREREIPDSKIYASRWSVASALVNGCEL